MSDNLVNKLTNGRINVKQENNVTSTLIHIFDTRQIEISGFTCG